MRSLLYIPVIGLALALGGCAETGARLLTDATYLHESASAYVREIHDLRRFVRAECRASMVREIDSLREEGDETVLRRMLAANYPGLVTVDIITGDDLTGVLSSPPGCGTGARAE